MTTRRLIFLIIFLFFNACTHTPKTSEDKDWPFDKERPLSALTDDGSVEYRYAAILNRVIKKMQGNGDLQTLTSDCQLSKAPKSVCFILKRIKFLYETIDEKNKIRTPIEIKPLAPISPIFKNGVINNWMVLKKGDIPELLKGLLSSTPQELHLLSNKTLAEKKCPVNIAIALAATLEDYLPHDVNPLQIGALYYKGGSCRQINAVDREHFFTRAALFYYLGKNKQQALEILKKVKPTDILNGRAHFWKLRISKELGLEIKDSSKKVIKDQRLAFHSLISSRILNTDIEFSQENIYLKRSLKVPKVNLLIEQAEIFKKYGFDYSASIITSWCFSKYNNLEPALSLYLLQLGDPMTQVRKGTEIILYHPNYFNKKNLEIIYPKPFFSLFTQYSSRVNPYLALAITRKESEFNPNAISIANAKGLMQLNPQTSKRLGASEDTNILEPEKNISLGTEYLRELYSRYHGNIVDILAAYNAGEIQIEKWRRRYITEDTILFIDLIPYRETRDYVGSVLSNYFWYQFLYEKNSVQETFSSLNL